MIQKNLFYQICPLTVNDQWRFNIECLLPFMSVFNGKIVLSIKTGALMAPVEDVLAYFNGFDNLEVFTAENNPALGESNTFFEGLEKLSSYRNDELTFYAHSKGISPKYLPEDIPAINKWTALSYSKNLESPETLDRLCTEYAFFGSFKRYKKTSIVPVSWHYSGSFYWFRHDVVFSKLEALKSMSGYYVSELLPGFCAPKKQGYCFYDDGAGDIYKYTDQTWREIDNPSTVFKLKRAFQKIT
jgi:hypothetical protein